MELTDKILTDNGFVNNHPDRLVNKFYYDRPDYHIRVNNVFIPRTNVMAWAVEAWKVDKDDIIIQRISISVIKTVEELQSVINLCNIDLMIYV